jgi:DNA-binding NarL/FixJ family response regulator
LGPARVLIVDDFGKWRIAICSILAEDPEFEVIGESQNGLDAVHKSGELLPDLVLMDIGLPGLNGLDAARRILEVSPKTKILFLSADHVLEVIREALNIGAGFVLKTDAGENLLAVARSIVRDEPFVRFSYLDECGDDSGEH